MRRRLPLVAGRVKTDVGSRWIRVACRWTVAFGPRSLRVMTSKRCLTVHLLFAPNLFGNDTSTGYGFAVPMFIVELSDRAERARIGSAEEAYRWLDRHAEDGERYALLTVNGGTGEVRPILEGLHHR